ncbi:disks large homolog 1-like isoform X2 [Rhopilema esculentum]|uniref:disks large homolog 1-like isoform X2 n=1 Tax=Rhopilema esculentum TaxID=499914 RepID=UPI0031D6BD00
MIKSYEGFSTFKPNANQTKEKNRPDTTYERTVEIEDFIEATITLRKEKTGLGVCIVGGSDTHFDRVLISGISPIGAAGKDGRLKCGDEILSVNDNDLQGASHDKAVQLLRMAKNPVRLTIYRENIESLFTSCQDPEKEFQVVLKKGINDNLGIGIYARKDGNGVFVTYIAPGSIAEACGLFEQGDRILQCNGKDMRAVNQMDALNILKSTFGDVRLLMGRGKSVEEKIVDLLESIDEEKKQDKSFKERRMRSRSDCTSTKDNRNGDSKRRTVTMNELGDTGCGSMMELISNQALDASTEYDNINLGFIEDEPHGEIISKNKEHHSPNSSSMLKSTLKKDTRKGQKRTDHVSFEMKMVQPTRASVLMYGDGTGV